MSYEKQLNTLPKPNCLVILVMLCNQVIFLLARVFLKMNCIGASKEISSKNDLSDQYL